MPITAQDRQDYASSAARVNTLTLAFAKAVGARQEDQQDNLIVSPYNALTALSMVAKGADTNTREEMAQTLFGTDAAKLDGEVDKLTRLNAHVLETNKDQVTLSTANGVWTNKEIIDLDTGYADTLKKLFGAEVSAEAFSDPTVPGKINKWAADNTNNLIDSIVDKLGKDDFAILASALYFKGEWTKKFDESLTKEKPFAQDNAPDAALTPTMHQDFHKKGGFTYQQGADYEAIAMTYGKLDYKQGVLPTVRMVLVRPTDEAVSAREWLGKQADAAQSPDWLQRNYESVVGSVEMPRLDIKQKHDLIDPLKDMGIQDAFNEKTADFSPMVAGKQRILYIGKATHDVVFKTDEKGSEAAAVTTIGMMRSTSVMRPPVHIDIKFDRSFAFALQDIETGTVLFAGAVNKPNNDMKAAPKLAAPKAG